MNAVTWDSLMVDAWLAGIGKYAGSARMFATAADSVPTRRLGCAGPPVVEVKVESPPAPVVEMVPRSAIEGKG